MTTRRNIAIVGASRESKLRAPYNDPRWEIWACSPSNENELPRHDVWFELHDTSILTREYREFLSGLPLIYMQDHYPEFPGSRPYPLDSMLESFGPHFFKWTPCYMLAVAIDRKPEEIGIWGMSHKANNGHAIQILATKHFIDLGRREGINVTCPPYLDAPLPLYGYDQ